MKHEVLLKKAGAVLFWLLVWQGAALLSADSIIFVGPVDMLRALFVQLPTSAFWLALTTSMCKIMGGFLLAFFFAAVFAAAAFRFPLLSALLEPVVQLQKSVPVASFVVLLLIFFGSEQLSVAIVFLMAFPILYIHTGEGLRHVDKQLLEMARVFRMRPAGRFLWIYRPALWPFLISGAKIALGMSWKSGVAAEIIGVPAHSIGEQLYMAKIYLNTDSLFAWTLVIILLSALFERLFLLLLRMAGGKTCGSSERERKALLLHMRAAKPARVPCNFDAQPEPVVRNFDAAHDAQPETVPCNFDAVYNAQPETVPCNFDAAHNAQPETVPCNFGAAPETASHPAQSEALRFCMPHPRPVTLHDVCKSYHGRPVIRGVSLTLEPGGVYALMGKSGSGKTTLLHLLAGLVKADSGVVQGAGDLRFSAVFQENRLCEFLTAQENIRIVQDRSCSNTDICNILSEILPAASLAQPVSEYSGGMKRRAAIARALLVPSDFILLDEPFAGLDAATKKQVIAFLQTYRGGRTLLFSTHEEADVQALRAQRLTITSLRQP